MEMSIILTDSLKYCPEFEGRTLVTSKGIKAYDGNTDVVAAICSRGMVNHLLSISLPNLKLIQLFSAGYDGINLSEIKDRGIKLCNALDVYNVGMAEFVVYSMLMSAKKYHRSIKNHCLRPFRNYHYITELYRKTVGIIGCGNIGLQIAKRLSAFDMNVIGYDINKKTLPYFNEIYVEDEMALFASQCDYIVCCIPLTKSTERLICQNWFSQFKTNVTFINVARKNVINDDDLIAFLKSNKDATAILDMLEMLPNPITNPYRRLSNVLVLPGVTAASIESMKRLHSLILENLTRFNQGSDLLNVIC